jgi:hypothetical protein
MVVRPVPAKDEFDPLEAVPVVAFAAPPFPPAPTVTM